jgi:hypothetical protein
VPAAGEKPHCRRLGGPHGPPAAAGEGRGGGDEAGWGRHLPSRQERGRHGVGGEPFPVYTPIYI